MEPPALRSTMMDVPLSIGRMIDHAADRHRTQTVTEVGPDGSTIRATYSELGKRCAALAAALESLEVSANASVGLMLDNRIEALEAMLAVPAMGLVVHPVNVLLSHDMIAATMASIGSEVLITGPDALEFLHGIRRQLPRLRHVVLIGTSVDSEDPRLPGVHLHSYEQLLDGKPARRDWPLLDERSAAVVCYTSGTTGTPKAVVYSHRAIWLHASQFSAVDGVALSELDTVATVVPLFHVMGWGIPFASLLVGNHLVLSRSARNSERTLGEAIERACISTRPTALVTTPVHFADFLRSIEHRPDVVRSVRRVIVGGSSLPPALLTRVREHYSFDLVQAWGMTETGPVGTAAAAATPGAQLTQGRFNAYMDARLVDVTGTPISGSTGIGELEVRGPFVTGAYLGADQSEDDRFDEGWLRTGDIADVTPDGHLTIIDRVADAILSGGEWISSVELENAVMELPSVAEAACIGVPDTRWGQRPLCVVVMNPGEPTPDPVELRASLTEVEMWKRPDHWTFVEEIPRTSVGKFDKRQLRTWFAHGHFEISHVNT